MSQPSDNKQGSQRRRRPLQIVSKMGNAYEFHLRDKQKTAHCIQHAEAAFKVKL